MSRFSFESSEGAVENWTDELKRLLPEAPAPTVPLAPGIRLGEG